MNLQRRQLIQATAGTALLGSLATGAFAQAYPAQTVKFIIPFPPGGTLDAVMDWSFQDRKPADYGALIPMLMDHFEQGDPVARDTVVALLSPTLSPMLDAIARARHDARTMSRAAPSPSRCSTRSRDS